MREDVRSKKAEADGRGKMRETRIPRWMARETVWVAETAIGAFTYLHNGRRQRGRPHKPLCRKFRKSYDAYTSANSFEEFVQ